MSKKNCGISSELTDILYRSDPTFTGARLSHLMDTLFGERESQVVKLAVRGLSNRDIARELGVSSQAIDAQRSKAMQKLGVANVADLVRLIQKVEG